MLLKRRLEASPSMPHMWSTPPPTDTTLTPTAPDMLTTSRYCSQITYLTTLPFKSLGSVREEITTFIHQRCIILIKSDSKDTYNVTKDF